MFRSLRSLSIATAIGVLAMPALAQDLPAGVQTVQSAQGDILADANGMTLYTFDRDEPGKSNCMNNCPNNWPPLFADAGAQAVGEWSVVAREDGTQQWAYKGQPLYTYVRDTNPGDIVGDGAGDVWHLAKP